MGGGWGVGGVESAAWGTGLMSAGAGFNRQEQAGPRLTGAGALKSDGERFPEVDAAALGHAPRRCPPEICHGTRQKARA